MYAKFASSDSDKRFGGGMETSPVNKRTTINVLLISEHLLFREGIRLILNLLKPEMVIDNVSDNKEAIQRLATGAYSLILLSLAPSTRANSISASLDGLAGLCSANPDTPVVVISGEDDPSSIRAAIESGAKGYLPKSATPELLIQALGLVLANGVYIPQSVLQPNRSGSSVSFYNDYSIPGLTQRQVEVLRGVIAGKANKTIAQELRLSDATVKAHLTLTYRILGVSSRTEAIVAASQMGLQLA